jgi:hypothetical protein
MYYVGCMTKFYIMSRWCAYVSWRVLHPMALFGQKALWNKYIYEWMNISKVLYSLDWGYNLINSMGTKPAWKSEPLEKFPTFYVGSVHLLPCSLESEPGEYVHTTPSYFSKITLIFHLHQNLTSGLFLPLFCRVLYMLFPYHSPWHDHSNYIWWRMQVMKLIMQFSLPSH